MTDEELIARLRITAEWVIGKEAADRIEALLLAQEALIESRDRLERLWTEAHHRALNAEAQLGVVVKVFDLIKARAMSTRGDQAYREFPRFAERTARDAISKIRVITK